MTQIRACLTVLLLPLAREFPGLDGTILGRLEQVSNLVLDVRRHRFRWCARGTRRARCLLPPVQSGQALMCECIAIRGRTSLVHSGISEPVNDSKERSHRLCRRWRCRLFGIAGSFCRCRSCRLGWYSAILLGAGRVDRLFLDR